LVEKLTAAAAAVMPLIKGFAEMVGTVEGMSEASDTMVQTLKSVSDETETAGSIADQFAKKMSVTAKETSGLNDVILWLGNNSSILGNTASRADLLAAATDGLHNAAVGASESYEQYLGIIDEYNSKIGDASLKTRALSEEQFQYNLVLQELEMGTGAAAHEMRKLEDGYRTGAAEIAVTEESTKSFNETLAKGTEGFRRREERMREAAGQWGDYQQRQESLAGAYAMVAASAEESAARQAEAAATAAQGQAELINSMKDATQEMFNQQILAAVDPAEIGVEAWANLGQELGLLDEKQVNLATAADELITAFKDGVIPTENMAEAAGELFTEAEKLEPKFGLILDHFADAPGKIGPSKDAMIEHHGIMSDMVDITPDVVGGIDDVASAFSDAKTPVEELKGFLDDVDNLMTELKGDHAINVTTTFTQVGSPPGGPGGFQMGGIVPGPIGQPRVILAHGGEIVSNPYQYGAVGGPGGPPAPTTNQYGGDTFNVNINDQMAAALFLDQIRRQRYDKLNARM
jgi:hypothetical protein